MFLSELSSGENRKRVAYHEAGHAVVAHSQKIEILMVTIGDGKKGYTYYVTELPDRKAEQGEFKACRSYALVLRAGRAAEKQILPDISDEGCRDDIAGYLSLCRPVLCKQSKEDHTVWDQRIKAECKALVDERWVAVDILAKGLLQRTMIPGEQVVKIIDAVVRD